MIPTPQLPARLGRPPLTAELVPPYNIAYSIAMPDQAEFHRLRRRAGNLTPQDRIRAAEAFGWTYTGVGGSGHHKLEKSARRPITIPNHSRLKRNTALGIIGQLEEDRLHDEEE